MSPSALIARPSLILVDGEWKPRRMGFVRRDAPVLCRRGHRIAVHGAIVDGLGAFPCLWRELRRRRLTGAQCRWVVCVVEGAPVGPFRCDLSAEEWAEMQERGWTARQILVYVGASMPETGDVISLAGEASKRA